MGWDALQRCIVVGMNFYRLGMKRSGMRRLFVVTKEWFDCILRLSLTRKKKLCKSAEKHYTKHA